MARPTLSGIDYFPLDVSADTEDSMFMVTAELGEIAFGRIIKLWAEIYKDRGYYKEWNEESELVFAGKKSIPIDEVKELVQVGLKRGIFNKKLYETYGILTSRALQKRYITACESRKNIRIVEKYSLIDPTEFKEKIKNKLLFINSDITGIKTDLTPEKESDEGVKSDITPVIPELIPQKKRKEKKRKESSAENLTPLNHSKNILYDRFEKARKHFNSLRLPEYRYTPENCQKTGEIIATFDENTDEEICEAMNNYDFVMHDTDYELKPDYPSGFIGFMRPGHGVDMYRNAVDPLKRCRKPGARASPGPMKIEKIEYPDRCMECGGAVRTIHKSYQCLSQKCGRIWNWENGKWILDESSVPAAEQLHEAGRKC